MQRFSSSAGIAIGPILFVIALLGILAAVMASGVGNFGVASTADRVKADIGTQANLIRSKINECYMQSLNRESVALVDNSEEPPFDDENDLCPHDAYPCSAADGTAVENLTCPYDPLTSGGSQQNIWTGLRSTLLPPPSPGFNAWTYVNAGDTGGRCFWTTPIAASGAIASGLDAVSKKFSSQEVSYQADSESQKIVFFITPPTGAVDEHCTVP